MSKHILIIDAHPDKTSFCSALAESYLKGASESSAKCNLIHLIDLHFDPILHYGYKKETPLEPDLTAVQQDILKADHLVFVFPTWWGTYPAILKCFIDRIFLPEYAFSYHKNSLLWDKLLNGKSARLIITMNTPTWYYRWIYKSPGVNSMKKSILNYCGIKPVKTTILGPVKNAENQKRTNWLKKVYKLGMQQK